MANLELPLQSRMFANDGIAIAPIGSLERVSLRADDSAFASIEKAFGLTLPKKPKTSVTKDDRTALWIGPDEWLILGQDNASLMQAFGKLRSQKFSAVDVSHRNCAIQISGENAVMVLNTGCPQDLSLKAFPVGACSRTVYAKAEIILLRTGENEFHLECWRSFSDYVWKFLLDSATSL